MPEKKYTRPVNIVDIYKNPITCLPDLQQFSSKLWICLLLCSIIVEIYEREAFIQKVPFKKNPEDAFKPENTEAGGERNVLRKMRCHD